LIEEGRNLWNEFQQVRLLVGAPLATAAIAVAIIVMIWLKWDIISKKPGVGELLAWLKRRSLPRAAPDHLTIALAHLENDKDDEHKKLLIDQISNEFRGTDVESIDRKIALSTGDTAAVTRATSEANRWRQRVGADVIIWGKVVTLNSNKAMRLYWTTGQHLDAVKSSGLYRALPKTISLPSLFWDDLKQVVGMLVQSRIAAFYEEGQIEQYSAARLAPLINQVRKLLQDHRGAWSAETDAGVRIAFANALHSYGSQIGDRAALQESIQAYRAALKEWSGDQELLDWAAMQMNLGGALAALGQHEIGTVHLEEAAVAYREALNATPRNQEAFQWAVTQYGLGSTLAILGQREKRAARLEEAVTAYRAALEAIPRDREPQDRARVKVALGTALADLGEREISERGVAYFREAVAAYCDALKIRQQSRDPMGWAVTQLNLGSALRLLGERENALGKSESGIAHVKEAVVACRAALAATARDRAPLNWATMQLGLGVALATLGECESGTASLKEAVVACRAALAATLRDRTPFQWAQAQMGLGTALAVLGQRESGTTHLEAAEAAYRDASEQFVTAGAEYYVDFLYQKLEWVRALMIEKEIVQATCKC
jgi:tetratricopeptide (TPR) repeat protein